LKRFFAIETELMKRQQRKRAARPVRILLHRVMLLADNTRLVGRTDPRALLAHRNSASGPFCFMVGGGAIHAPYFRQRRIAAARGALIAWRSYSHAAHILVESQISHASS
jgi:hypothetical protein